jgi:SAM-dependent methyltransferase
MHTDVTDLRDFYQTPLGLVARRLVAQRIRARWPKLTGGTVIGFGFASPFLGSFRAEATRIGALMPTSQGALVWPTAERAMSVLVEEEQLPLPDNSVDRLLVIHGLEVAERPAALLRELWRVLAPAGQMLLVVPNRQGIWARTDRTPFGQGRPYSRAQLDALLRQSMFTPTHWDSALFLLPFDRGIIVRSANTMEKIGHRFSGRFAGVIVAEATKELIAPIGPGRAVQVLRPRLAASTGALAPNGGRL